MIHAENNLGLESWCTQHVYEYAHKTIFNKKIENPKSIHCISIVKYLNCAILINPDVATFWNLRRKLFINNKLNITKEFKFSSIVLSKKPKSNEAFCYRRWLFSFQSKSNISSVHIFSLSWTFRNWFEWFYHFQVHLLQIGRTNWDCANVAPTKAQAIIPHGVIEIGS